MALLINLINLQLNSLVDEMCCERNRISFYCLDLFPFKSISTYEVINQFL